MARIVYRSSAGLAVIIGVVMAVVLFGTDQGMEAPSAQAQSSPAGAPSAAADSGNGAVQVMAVSPTVEDLHRVTTQPAQIEAHERTDIYAKASGFISKVFVDIGDQVEQDQILAELWIPEMVLEERQKAALVEQTRAAVEQAQARLASAEALTAAAEANLAASQAAIEQQTAEVDYRRSEHKRISDLVASRSVNESLQDEKLKQVRAAEAALSAARAQAEAASASVRVEHARILQANADVAFAQAQLRVAEADLERIRIVVKYAQIRAPYAGLVTWRWADTGDFVVSAADSTSEPLFTVDRVDKLRIVFDVPESESAMIQTGLPTSLVVDALKGRAFAGQVVRTAGVLDQRTRTLRVEAALSQADAALRPGMYGMITITLAKRRDAVLLPVRCIRFEEQRPFVFCVGQGRVEKREIELGYNDGTKAEVVQGVSGADSVVLESRFPLRPGLPVQVAPARN